MTLTDADYQEVKKRLARDTLTVNVLHVIGDLDCRSISTRVAFQLGNGSHLLSGIGVPNPLSGVNGDFYFREDGSASAYLYFKASGAWGDVV